MAFETATVTNVEGQTVYVVIEALSAVSASAYTLEVECIKPKQ